MPPASPPPLYALLAPLACAMCGKQTPEAARIAWVDLALLAVPFALVALGAWVFAREMRRAASQAEAAAGAAAAPAASSPREDRPS